MPRSFYQGIAVLLLAGWAFAQNPGHITGQIQTATGGTITNGTLTFTLSQPSVVSGTATLVTQPVSCYTSNGGNIVGVPDPIIRPILSTNTVTGTLPAATYFVQIYYTGPSGTVSAVSPEASVVLSALGTVIVQPPALQPNNATGYGVAMSTTSGTETIQGTVSGFASQFQQSTPLVAGATPGATNNTVCNLFFSDALIPTGTYYSVNLVNKNGSPIAGYPQSWCTYGGSGGTINVSQGTPTGICNVSGVFYPTPILQNTQNATAQSISTNLSVGGNLSVTGNGSFLGTNTFGNLNGVVHLDGVKYTTFAAAAAACPNPGTLIVDTPGTWTVSANLTIPSTCALQVYEGANISISTGVTLTINGPFSAPPTQVFTYNGSGTATFNVASGSSSPSPILPQWFPGVDPGAQINNAYAACPSTGCIISVVYPGNCHGFATPIVLNTPGKLVALVGPTASATCLQYTPTTGIAITLDVAGGGSGLARPGIYDLELIGPGNGTATTGIQIGGVNGTVGAQIEGVIFGSGAGATNGFGTGILFAAGNDQDTVISKSSLQDSGTCVSLSSAEEAIKILNSTINHCTTAGISVTFPLELFIYGTSIDDNAVGISCTSSAAIDLFTPHFENSTVAAAASPYIALSGGCSLLAYGGSMGDDRVSGTNSGFITSNAGSEIDIYGMGFSSSGITVTQVANLSGSGTTANFFSNWSSANIASMYNTNYGNGQVLDCSHNRATPKACYWSNYASSVASGPLGAQLITGQTANIGSTNMGGAVQNTGLYLVCISLFPTATGTATAIQATITGTNGNAYTANVGSVLSLSALGNTGGGCLPVTMVSGNTFSVATTGYAGTGTYTLRAVVSEIQ